VLPLARIGILLILVTVIVLILVIVIVLILDISCDRDRVIRELFSHSEGIEGRIIRNLELFHLSQVYRGFVSRKQLLLSNSEIYYFHCIN